MPPLKICSFLLLFFCLSACADDPQSKEKAAQEAPRTEQSAAAPNKIEPPAPPAKAETEALPKPGAASGAEIKTHGAPPANDGKAQDASGEESGGAPQPENDFNGEKAEAARPLTEAEIQLANKIVSFSNAARDILGSGAHAAADTLNDNARRYIKNWRLPERPKLPQKYSADPRLKAPPEIFTKAEEAALAKALDDMDKALNALFGHYKSLEKYVADSSIIDDGKKGLELSDKIARGHFEYMSAKRTWLEIVEARAARAEAELLRDHPLQRQILSAQSIFAQMREAGDLLRAEPDNRKALEIVAKNLDAVIAEAALPPFQASPALERLYRNFLKEAKAWNALLSRGVLEGFFSAQKSGLVKAFAKCRDAYNDFVRAVNASG